MKIHITHPLLHHATQRSVIALRRDFPDRFESDDALRIYPIPRGGFPVAYMLNMYMPLTFVDRPEDADIIYDDLEDSGVTRSRYAKYNKPFYTLFNKNSDFTKDEDGSLPWLIFPWESSDTDTDASDHAARLLEHGGKDVNNENMQKLFDVVNAIEPVSVREADTQGEVE